MAHRLQWWRRMRLGQAADAIDAAILYSLHNSVGRACFASRRSGPDEVCVNFNFYHARAFEIPLAFETTRNSEALKDFFLKKYILGGVCRLLTTHAN